MSQNAIMEKIAAKLRRTDLPEFAAGDTVRVHVKIREGDKERLQAFEGTVIARSRGPQGSLQVALDSQFPFRFDRKPEHRRGSVDVCLQK